MMLSPLKKYQKKIKKICLLCFEELSDTVSSPDNCEHLFHYKCLREYADDRIIRKESVICPISECLRIFGRISNKYKNSVKMVYQNVILSNDETQCCICFSKYKVPVASSDSCSHTFCLECLKKWCTFKHECPMDRVPIKMLLISDFPGSHIIDRIVPPTIEQDLVGDGDNDDLVNTTCEVCNSGHNEHQLLLCDNCDRGYHIYCLSVPLSMIPEGDWYCDECQTHSNAANESRRRIPRGLPREVRALHNRFARTIESPNRQSIGNISTTRQSRSNQDIPLRSAMELGGILMRSGTRLVAEEEVTGLHESFTSDRLDRISTYRNNRVRLEKSEDSESSEEEPIKKVRKFSNTRSARKPKRKRRKVNYHLGSLCSDILSKIVRKKRKTEKVQEEDEKSDSSSEEEDLFNYCDDMKPTSSSKVKRLRTRSVRQPKRKRTKVNNPQGSLSSDIQSEVERKRRKRTIEKVEDHTDSMTDSSLTEDESDSTSEDEEFSNSCDDTNSTSSSSITNLNARSVRQPKIKGVNDSRDSLSSDLQSEIGRKRKKVKGYNISKRYLSLTAEDSDNISDGEELSYMKPTSSSKIIELKTGTNQSILGNRLPKYSKHTKKISENPNENIIDDKDEPFVIKSAGRKRRLIVESDSNSEKGDGAERVTSTSTLFTAPRNRVTTNKPAHPLAPQLIKPKQEIGTITKDTSIDISFLYENTNADVTPDLKNKDIKPSTSSTKRKPPKKTRAKKRSSKTSKSCKRSGKLKLYKRPKIKAKKFKRKITKLSKQGTGGRVTRKSKYVPSPSKLSILGRENLQPVSDSEDTAKQKILSGGHQTISRSCLPGCSVLSAIGNAQNNLKNMSLSTIQRLPDGTVVHKSQEIPKPIATSLAQCNITTVDLSKDISNRKVSTENDNVKDVAKASSSTQLIHNSKGISKTFTVPQTNTLDRYIGFIIPKQKRTEQDNMENLASSRLKESFLRDTNELCKKVTTSESSSKRITQTDIPPPKTLSLECNGLLKRKSDEIVRPIGTAQMASSMQFSVEDIPKVRNVGCISKQHSVIDILKPKDITKQIQAAQNCPNSIIQVSKSIRSIGIETTLSSSKSFGVGDNKKLTTQSKTVSFAIPELQKDTMAPLEMHSTTQSSSGSMKIDISNYISVALKCFYVRKKINKEEFKMLKSKIMDKVMKRTSDKSVISEEKKVKEYVEKYVSFHLSKRKHGDKK